MRVGNCAFTVEKQSKKSVCLSCYVYQWRHFKKHKENSKEIEKINDNVKKKERKI